jgi:fucose permease
MADPRIQIDSARVSGNINNTTNPSVISASTAPLSPTTGNSVLMHSSKAAKQDANQLIASEENFNQVRIMKRRWLMLFLFSCCTCLSALAWIVYSPIFALLQELYGLSTFSVQFMSYSYMILFLPCNIPSVIALEKYGLRVGIVIGISLSALGIILKVFIDQSYAWVLTG